VLAADIPFHHRFLYDFDVHACIRAYGKEGWESNAPIS
jgi:DNA polymerase I